jgi:hypothetical protein
VSPLEREGSLLALVCADRGRGSEAVSPVAIVWPCPFASMRMRRPTVRGDPSPVLPVVCRAASDLVGVPALCPGGRPMCRTPSG